MTEEEKEQHKVRKVTAGNIMDVCLATLQKDLGI